MEIEKASGASLNAYSLKLIIQCEMAELINRRYYSLFVFVCLQVLKKVKINLYYFFENHLFCFLL